MGKGQREDAEYKSLEVKESARLMDKQNGGNGR